MKLVSLLALSGLLIAGPAHAAKDVFYAVVVVPEAPSRGAPAADRASIDAARAALRGGVKAAGNGLLSEKSAQDLAGLADRAGTCDAACETRMRSRVGADRLLLGRLAAAGGRFTLTVSDGTRVVSAIGERARMGDAGTQLGLALGSGGADGRIAVEGADDSAPVFVGGARAAAGRGGVVTAPAGTHVVRIGEGRGEGAVRNIAVIAGQVTTARFPRGTRGADDLRSPGGAREAPASAVRAPSPSGNAATAASAKTGAGGWARSPWTWVGAGALVLLAGGAAAVATRDDDPKAATPGAPTTTIEIGD